MTIVRHRHLDVTCELDQAEAGTRAAEWDRLRAEYGLRAEGIAGGARLWLDRQARSAAEDLVRRESACCGFLDLELTDDADLLRLDISSPAPEAARVIAYLAGLDSSCGPACC